MTVSSCKLVTLQTYLETASSQQQSKNGNSLPSNTLSSKSLNSFQNNLDQHLSNYVRRSTMPTQLQIQITNTNNWVFTPTLFVTTRKKHQEI